METVTRAQGQDGDPIEELFFEEMNEDERKIAKYLAEEVVADMPGLVKLLQGKRRNPEDPSSPVRNAMRRLCRAGLVVTAPRSGFYEKTKKLSAALDLRARAVAIIGPASKTEIEEAMLVLSAREHGGSDSKVMHAMKCSRGYAKRRVDRLKREKWIGPDGRIDPVTLRAMIACAEGRDQ